MAAEPINIFSHKIDPRGVVAALRGLAPDLKVVGPEDDWTRVEIAVGRPGLVRKPAVIAVSPAREH